MMPQSKTVCIETIWDLYEKGFSLIPLGSYGEAAPPHIVKRFDGDTQKANQQWPKTPRIDWKYYQSHPASAQQVEQWLSMYPNCNWGVITGPQIVVVDADSAEAALWVHNNLTRTPWTVKTGKGRHFVYQTNTRIEIKNMANPAAQVDVRGYGGYVVAAGSIHANGEQYEWHIDDAYPVDNIHDLPTLTDEDISKIRMAGVEQAQTQAATGTGNLQFNAGSVHLPHDGSPVQVGGRNNAAASLVGQYIRQGKALDEIKGLLDTWNNNNPQPLPQGELNTTIASVVRTHTTNNPQAAVQVQKPRRDPSTLLIPISELQVSAPEWLIKGVLPHNAIGMLFGPSSGGKSFAAIDMGLSIAAGRDWHGRKTKRQGGVIYVCGEGQQGIANRIRAWEKHTGVAVDDLPFRITRGPVRMLDDADKAALIEAVKAAAEELGGVVIVIIDTLNRNFGDGDENSTKDMTRFIDAITDIHKQLEAGVQVVHHTNLTDGERARGNGSLKNACDYEIKHSLISDPDAPVKEFSLVGRKMKDGSDMAPCRFTLQFVPLGKDEDGEDFGSCVIELNPDSEMGANAAEKLIANKQDLTEPRKKMIEVLTDALRLVAINQPEELHPKIEKKVLVDELKKAGVDVKNFYRLSSWAESSKLIKTINSRMFEITISKENIDL